MSISSTKNSSTNTTQKISTSGKRKQFIYICTDTHEVNECEKNTFFRFFKINERTKNKKKTKKPRTAHGFKIFFSTTFNDDPIAENTF